MKLHTISDNKGATKKLKRVGRGPGSGLGKTSGRGMKGQTSRSGVAIKGFEGGQMPIHMRMPKRGFNSINKKVFRLVSLFNIDNAVSKNKISSSTITPEILEDIGLISKKPFPVKVLSSRTELSNRLEISGVYASNNAIKTVNDNGGNIVLLSSK